MPASLTRSRPLERKLDDTRNARGQTPLHIPILCVSFRPSKNKENKERREKEKNAKEERVGRTCCRLLHRTSSLTAALAPSLNFTAPPPPRPRAAAAGAALVTARVPPEGAGGPRGPARC
eukprot:1181254-Prorocentrum_minimum.AAC.1